MRARMFLLLVAIALVSGFAALNWSEFTRSTPLNFGLAMIELPFGLLMLSLLALAAVVFLASSGAQHTRYLLALRDHDRQLRAQRDLAERAEASRFTELRQHLDTQWREIRQREAVAGSAVEQALAQQQRETRAEFERLGNALSAQIEELDHRLTGRVNREPVRTEPLRTEREVRTGHL